MLNTKTILKKGWLLQFDPEVKEKERRSFESRKIFNPFNKNEINKSLKHINSEMEKSAEKFYSKKEKKTTVYYYRLSLFVLYLSTKYKDNIKLK